MYVCGKWKFSITDTEVWVTSYVQWVVFNIYLKHKIKPVCEKSNLFAEGIIIRGNQATCPTKVVRRWERYGTGLSRGSVRIVTSTRVIKKCAFGAKWNIARQFWPRCTNLYFLKLSNILEKCGLSEQWRWNRVDQVLIPVLEDSVFIFKTCVIKIEVTSF